MSPTRWTAAAAGIIAVVALVLPLSIVFLITLGLLTLVALDLRLASRPPTVDRRLAHLAARGVRSEVEIDVTCSPAVHARVRQPVPPDLELTPDEADHALTASLVPRRRGRHEVAAPTVRCTGPLRLGRWDHAVGDPAEVVVYPDLPAARRLADLVRQGRFDPQGRRRRGPLGLGTEFEYVRDYSPDDDIRQVNWLATARVGRPMSNQYRLDQERDVTLVIDSGRLMAAPLGDRTRLDAAVDAAVAVAAVADVLGDRCGVVTFAGSVRRRLPPHRAGSQRVVEAVYDLEPVGEDSDYELAFATVGGGKRALILVLTDLLDEAAARSLVAAVPVLSRRHAVVVASVVDPDIASIMRTPPATLIDACAQSVASELTDARARVVAQLGRAGATVVETAPDRFSAGCVATYLGLKARARL